MRSSWCDRTVVHLHLGFGSTVYNYSIPICTQQFLDHFMQMKCQVLAHKSQCHNKCLDFNQDNSVVSIYIRTVVSNLWLGANFLRSLAT